MSAKEINGILASTQNKVGLLAEISTATKSAGINITAIAAYEKDQKAYFMLVTSDNAGLAETLKKKGYSVREENAVEAELENKLGTLAGMAAKLAEANINLEYLYGTTSKSPQATIIFSSDNNGKAIKLLK